MYRPLAAAALLGTLLLAGCTAPISDGVDIQAVVPEDPRTEAMRFEATGDAESFTWEFGDGTPPQEGRIVEHLWGFADGIVQVRLTACAAGACTTTLRSIDLGGERNTPPQGALDITTNWDARDQVITLSARGSTDANNDPILFRWTCTRLGDLQPAVESPHYEVGLPFGVQFLAAIDATVAGDGPTVAASSFCDGEPDDGFTRTDVVHMELDAEGVYRIEVEVKDPKSAASVGRADLFVSADHPGAAVERPFSGNIPVAAASTLDPFCSALADPGLECPVEGVAEHRFQLPICIASGEIRFASESDASPAAWVLSTASGARVAAGGDGTVLLGPSDLCHGREYVLQVQADGPAATLEYDWTLSALNDLEPRHLYAEPGH